MRRLISWTICLLVIFCVVLGFGTHALGYDVRTHRLINEAIFGVTALPLYFDNDLKMPLTDSQTFQGQTALDLMREGGVAEDSPDSWCYLTPYPRAYNHYHDPLRSWDQAGYTNPAWYNGISSVLYAQYNRLTSPPPLALLQCPEVAPNVWTWDNAYRYFRIGLTAQDNAMRNRYLADMFTALGHLTHLVADMSVPEHSRNDAHLLRSYESWCVENLTRVNSTIGGVRVFDNIFPPDPGIFAQGQGGGFFGSGVLSPVSNLWDSNLSGADNGYNPALRGSRRLEGLADYSNYNYLSGDTVFKDYAHPSREEVGLRLIPRAAPDGQTDYVLYFNRNTSDGVPVQHLAATDLVFLDSQAPLDNSLRYVAAHLDPLCWENYASNLVPRAVSYGTSLVDYFFRGKFDASGSGSTLTVTNRSSGPATGTFAVYRDDPADGLRKPVPGLENLAVPVLGLGSGSTTTFTVAGFSPPSSTDNLLLVFTGTLANEGAAPNADPAVAGKAFSWTAPQVTYPVAWRPIPPTLNIPFTIERRHWFDSGISCYACHFGPYPGSTKYPMINQELCKTCHGSTSVGGSALFGTNPIRVLVSPGDAHPSWKVASPVVDTFNPANGATVSGMVQFVAAVFQRAHGTASPSRYRVEVRKDDGVLMTNYPSGPWSVNATGWQPATSERFLRNTAVTEALLWDSRTVDDGTYDFEFYPMMNPLDWGPGYSGWSISIGNPAVLRLTVRNR